MEETWKDIPGYEGYYQVSDLGRVKSLERVVMRSNGRPYKVKEKLLKPSTNSCGYFIVSLHLNNSQKSFSIHKLVAMAFLGNTTIGSDRVVDHIDRNKLNNKLSNLRIVTNRQNHKNSEWAENSSSKYHGVCAGGTYACGTTRWKAQIRHNLERFHLGCFKEEIEAHKAYQKALKQIKEGTFNK